MTTWCDKLLKTDKRVPKALLGNAITALRLAPDWVGVLAFDSFALNTMAMKAPPWQHGANDWQPRPWVDRDDALATKWMHEQRIAVGLQTTEVAIATVAQDHAYHPVQEYLGDLEWDGKARIANFATTYLGATITPYVKEVSERFLISAVARVMSPGCKADNMLILEGHQGIGKSAALRAMTEPWFTDEVADLGSKDAALQCCGVWLIEVSELDGMSRPEVSKIKAFLSRTIDRFRPPYGRHIVAAPRQCIFAGSTNSSEYLKDETGGRRFWPIRCGRINIEAIDADRDQLWAEAFRRFRDGREWWFGPAAAKIAAGEQAQRYVGDPWDDIIADHIRRLENVSVAEILNHLGVVQAHWTQQDQNRVARCLISQSWERYQQRLPGGDREWRYRPVTGAQSDDKLAA